MLEWAEKRTVSLHFDYHETCTFIESKTRKVRVFMLRMIPFCLLTVQVDSKTQWQVEYTGGYLHQSKWSFLLSCPSFSLASSCRSHKVTEWFWNLEIEYALRAYEGTALSSAVHHPPILVDSSTLMNQITICSRRTKLRLRTLSDTQPFPKASTDSWSFVINPFLELVAKDKAVCRRNIPLVLMLRYRSKSTERTSLATLHAAIQK